jgi:deoxyribodipyrimidine photolyase
MEKVDSRVIRILKKKNFSYLCEKGGSGIIHVFLDIHDDDGAQTRSQWALVRSQTTTLHEELREVQATAHVGEIPPPEVLAHCLKQNDLRRGSWRLRVDDENEKVALVYAMEVNADADENELALAITTAAHQADRLERKLSSQDKF